MISGLIPNGMITCPSWRRRLAARCGGLQDVVAWVGLVGDVGPLGRERTEPARLVVLECLDQLGPGVHDERAVRGDWLPDWLAAEHQQFHALARAVRPVAGAERQRVARAEYGELT